MHVFKKDSVLQEKASLFAPIPDKACAFFSVSYSFLPSLNIKNAGFSTTNPTFLISIPILSSVQQFIRQRSFSSRCWSTEVVCVSGILCSPFALFCIIMPRPTGGYPSAAGSYHLIFCNFFVFFRLVFDIRLPCSILYNDMELTIRGVVPTALHTPAFFRARQTRRFFA